MAICFSPIAFAAFSQTSLYSLSFDDTDDYVTIPSDFDYPSRTILVKFLATDVPPVLGQIYSSHNMGLVHGLTQLGFNSDTTLGYQVGGNSDRVPVNLNQWYSVAIVADSNSSDLYVDGMVVKSLLPSAITGFGPSSETQIGCTHNYDRFFAGHIDELSIWKIALDSVLVNHYISYPPVAGDSGLIAYWDFDGGSGTSLANNVGGGSNGSLKNGTAWSTSTAPYYCLTGSREFNSEKLKIFPNPASNEIYISNYSNFRGSVIPFRIFDISGKIVMEGSAITGKQVEIPVTSLPDGLYLLRLSDKHSTFARFSILR